MDIIPKKTSTEIGKKKKKKKKKQKHQLVPTAMEKQKKSITVKYGNNNALRLVTLKSMR